MPEVIDEIIRQINQLLEYYEKKLPSFILPSGYGHDRLIITQTSTRLLDGIRRYAPPRSDAVRNAESFIERGRDISNSWVTEQFAGILYGLKADYETGMLKSVHELIHADLFSDFLEMAEHLHQQKYIGPAAVLAGCVLEEHIRKLCNKNSIDIERPTAKGPTYRHVEELNTALVKAGVYDKNVQKGITHWYGLRTSAAHGKTDEYTEETISLMIQGIRDFLTRCPA